MRTLLAAAVLVLGTVVSSQAQIVYGQPASGSLSFTYTHWSLESGDAKTTIGQVSLPVSGFLPLGENMDAQFYLGGTSNSLKTDVNDYSMSGLEDLRLQINRSLSNDHLLLSLGASLPTGKKELNLTEEWRLVQALSQDFLNFPVRRLGEGLGLNFLVGGVTMLGQIRAGAGIGYSLLGSYTPYEGGDDYNPGDILTANLGFDTKRENTRWALQMLHTYYATDKFKELKSFRQGPVTQFILSGERMSDRFSVGGQASYILRGRNQRYAYPAETLVDQLKLFGNEFSLGANCGFTTGPQWTIAPFASARFIQANEETLDNSHIYGIGSGIVRAIGQGNIEARFGWYTGQADGGTIDLSGIQVSCGARVTF